MSDQYAQEQIQRMLESIVGAALMEGVDLSNIQLDFVENHIQQKTPGTYIELVCQCARAVRKLMHSFVGSIFTIIHEVTPLKAYTAGKYHAIMHRAPAILASSY